MTLDLLGALASYVALTGGAWFILKGLMGDGPEPFDLIAPTILTLILPFFLVALCLYPIWGPLHWLYCKRNASAALSPSAESAVPIPPVEER